MAFHVQRCHFDKLALTSPEITRNSIKIRHSNSQIGSKCSGFELFRPTASTVFFLREKVATPRRCKENASRQMGATFQLWRLSMGQRRVPRFYLDRQFSRSFPNYIFIRFGNVACDSHNCSVVQLNDRRVFQGNAWTFQYRPDFLRLSKWKSR